MKLPLPLDYAPMDARAAREIPVGDDWQYEPKWDGFRCLAFRDHEEVKLESKAGQELERYFPEVVEALTKIKATRFVLDGELVVIQEGRANFDLLLQRIHPAASRVQKLSRETPAVFVLFDVLVDEHGYSLVEKPLKERRPILEAFFQKHTREIQSVVLSPYAYDLNQAKKWLTELRGALDGIVAKRLNTPYDSGGRDSMVKIKNIRTADCVVGGFRYLAKEKLVGSLLLGLYDGENKLNHVGFTSSMPRDQRASLTKKLESMIEEPGFTGARPGGPSRWSRGRNTDWFPLAPRSVVEVEFDHFSGHRFRHGTKFLRWRPDKKPEKCTITQVAFESSVPLPVLKATATE
jgi:ATP-dependent DNA ligase